MKNVVVTGMGVLSTAGYNLTDFWNTLYSCRITYGPMEELIDDTNYRIKIGAKIKSKEWLRNVPAPVLSKYGNAACYSVSTTLQAIDDAKIDLTNIDKKRIGVIIGTTMGEIEVEEKISKLKCSGNQIDDSLYRKYPSYNIVKAVSDITGAQGYLYTIPAACAAGNYAVSIAKKLLDWNCVDMVIAGGVDVFSYVAFAGFQRLLSLTPDLCRPFDKNRKGLVVGEGCGIIIMEREGDRKNQKIYGRILGSGLASDAYHMTAPNVNGEGELTAMKKAIKDADIAINNIDYISAHGTGTKLNDKIEAKAIKELFKQNAPAVSSIKSMIGHSMGAASLLELIASCLMIKHQVVLPTVNYQEKDPDCDLDIVANKPTNKKIKYIMSNSFAFGGQTSSILIGV